MRIPYLDLFSLNPPNLSADEATAAQEKLPWVLLEQKAYVAKRDNATTAFSVTSNGKPIQATFCALRPPLVSYMCLHCPDAAEIQMEPRILAADEEFVLLSVVTPGAKEFKPGDIHIDYYIYQADGSEGRPSLARLPRPPIAWVADNAGILSYRDDRTGGRECIVAALRHELRNPVRRFDFGLCLYDSKRGYWTSHDVSLNKPQMRRRRRDKKRFFHTNHTVLTVGGDGGTMAFVDLLRGILFCDVLKVEDEAACRTKGEPMPLLRYVPVPEPFLDDDDDDDDDDDWPFDDGDALCYRNIAVVGDRLKYVKLLPHRRPTDAIVHHSDGLVTDGYFIDGWMAATWSRPATCSSSPSDDNRWSQDTIIADSSTTLKVPNSSNFKNITTRSARDIKSFDARQPVLGLQDDADIVYFTALSHIGCDDENAWVAAVDMRKKELLGVAPFSGAPIRYAGMDFAYAHSRISKHLDR